MINVLAKIVVTITPHIAGIIFASITLDNFTLKLLAAAKVFGFGEIIFPAFPPPNAAKSIANFEYPNLWPIDIPIGPTVSTTTSKSTPTLASTIDDNTIPNIAFFIPRIFIISSEILSTAPVFINVAAKKPDVITLRIAGAILWAPLAIYSTVSTKLVPPTNPPTNAPKTKQ